MAVKTIDSVRGDDQLVASTYQESGDDTIGRASGLAASSAYCAMQHRGFNATNGKREDGETRFSGLARYTRVSKASVFAGEKSLRVNLGNPALVVGDLVLYVQGSPGVLLIRPVLDVSPEQPGQGNDHDHGRYENCHVSTQSASCQSAPFLLGEAY